jgi:hypothetical protein
MERSGMTVDSPLLLGQEVLAHLRAMDHEATTVSAKGSPTGLNWYGGHARPELKKPQTEPEWSKELARRLTDGGVESAAEVPYPNSPRARCDAVSTLPDGSRVWIEIKGAWREYWRQYGKLGTYRSYLLHPLVAGLDPKSHTVPLDMEKLAGLSPEDASFVAILLVGFDSAEHPMDADIDKLRTLSGLGAAPWTEIAEEWPDPHRDGECVHCWLWLREVV